MGLKICTIYIMIIIWKAGGKQREFKSSKVLASASRFY